MHKSMRYAVAAAVAATATLLTACSDGDAANHSMGAGSPSSSTAGSAGTPASGPHNQADVDFATGMVPHHGQALVMADMALRHGGSAEFVALATAIKQAQKPEIDQMGGWLAGWGQPRPHSTVMHHGGSNSMGMMSDEDMARLEQSTGGTFEEMWLEGMITHHQGAVNMSKTHLDQGSNPEAKALAQRIVDAQTTEIATMRAMLG